MDPLRFFKKCLNPGPATLYLENSLIQLHLRKIWGVDLALETRIY